MICLTCGRNTEKVFDAKTECSHVDCPYRVPRWADVHPPSRASENAPRSGYDPGAGLFDDPESL